MLEALPPIELTAIDGRRNVRRRYSIVASHDLFGWITVETSWGRIGSKGSSAVHGFCNTPHALEFVRRTLQKRATARVGVGVPYSLQSPLPDQENLRTWLDGFSIG